MKPTRLSFEQNSLKRQVLSHRPISTFKPIKNFPASPSVCVCPPRPRPVEAPLDLPSTTFVRDLQKCWQNPWSGPSREMWPGDMNSGRRSASEARRVLVALERRRTARSEQLRCHQPGGKLRLRPVTQLSATSGPRTQAGLAGRLLFRRAVRGTGLLTFKDCQVMLVGSTVHCAEHFVVQLVIEKASLAFAQHRRARCSWVKEL